jgi:hypothetical protein
MTLCAVVSAFSATTGVAATTCLLMMTLALWARRGMFVLAMLALSCLAADWPGNPLREATSPVRQLVIIGYAVAVSHWFRFRRCPPRGRRNIAANSATR